MPDTSHQINRALSAPGTLALSCLILVIITRLTLELTHLDQPIFEGYVGRQIPTAMVARDLTRGGDFLHPSLQTGPFPSYFLVEPPVYAQIVAWLHQASGLKMETCGRTASLAGVLLVSIAIWRYFSRNDQKDSACFAVTCWLALPVSLKYGRAFQPDMLALGLIFFGLCELASGNKKSLSNSLSLFAMISLGLAMKVTLAPLLVVMFAFDENLGRKRLSGWLLKSILMLLPALAWYFYVILYMKAPGSVSGGQSADGFYYWLKMVGPLSLLANSSFRTIWINPLWRSWTPLAILFLPIVFILAMRCRFLKYSFFGVIIWLLLVGGKAHHGYYWLVPAPWLAIITGIFAANDQFAMFSPRKFRYADFCRKSIVICMMLTGLYQSINTWKTPEEWRPLAADLNPIRLLLDKTPGQFVVAHEAAVYALDRPGLRWEWSPQAQRRAASAFDRGQLSGDSPAALLAFYQNHGGRWFLAIETDPEWIAKKQGLAALLPDDHVVYRAGGLILYDLKSPPP